MMGLTKWLFGSKEPARTPVHLAPGRGFTFDVVGEGSYQDNLDRLCGGKCEDGHKLECTAHLEFDDDNEYDANAVAVLIERIVVGYIPREKAEQFRVDVRRINPEQKPVICKAKVVGGWDYGDGDSGHYGVKLSIASPLRLKG